VVGVAVAGVAMMNVAAQLEDDIQIDGSNDLFFLYVYFYHHSTTRVTEFDLQNAKTISLFLLNLQAVPGSVNTFVLLYCCHGATQTMLPTIDCLSSPSLVSSTSPAKQPRSYELRSGQHRWEILLLIPRLKGL
jgi:hypothetical protein